MTIVEPGERGRARPRRDRRLRLRAARARGGGHRAGRRVRRRHRQRHHEPLAGRRRAPREPRTCSSPPGRTSRPARRCSPPSSSTRCWCPPRWSRTRCTRSWRPRCCWRFLREMPARGDDWADGVIGRLTDLCGTRLQSLWKVRLSARRGAGAAGRGSPGTRCGSATCCAAPTTATTTCTPSSLLVARGDDVLPGAPRRLHAGPRRRDAAGRRARRAPAARLHAAHRRDPGVRAARPARAVELDLAAGHPTVCLRPDRFPVVGKRCHSGTRTPPSGVCWAR